MMRAGSVEYPLTLYYDASCPFCKKEMDDLKSYDSQDRLRLIDCSPVSFRDALAEVAGITRAEMMALIHARDGSGRWMIGVEVFILAYRAVGIEMMAGLYEFPLLRPLWNRLYPWVARHRMGLSRLGLNRAYEGLVHWAARRAHKRAQVCATDKYETD
jgi:predicted DCC family thiol-disulfide oxidoreductase YuxK